MHGLYTLFKKQGENINDQNYSVNIYKVRFSRRNTSTFISINKTNY